MGVWPGFLVDCDPSHGSAQIGAMPASRLSITLRRVWFDCKEASKHPTLLGRVFVIEPRRIQDLLTHRGRDLPQVMISLTQHALTIPRHLIENLRSSPDIPFPLGRQPVERLVPGEDARTLRRRLHIERMRTLHSPVLLIDRKASHAGLAAKQVFLCGGAPIVVLRQPLRKRPLPRSRGVSRELVPGNCVPLR